MVTWRAAGAAAKKQALLLLAHSQSRASRIVSCRHFAAEPSWVPSKAASSTNPGGGLNISQLLQQLQKPRVAPLPEDRVHEEQDLEVLREVSASTRAVRPLLDDIPLPSFVVTKQEKRPDPLVLLDAIRMVKVGSSRALSIWHMKGGCATRGGLTVFVL